MAYFYRSGAGSSSGNATTTKNYLSTYKSNPGNGDFELGNTTGWGKFGTTLTGVIPTGAIVADNTSISTFTTIGSGSQLAGNYSLDVVWSTLATQTGQGIISNAFTIDNEDQAKVLTFKFYYKTAAVNVGNFSGTSSNTFAVYIYDVTNSAWIQPTGCYGITQGPVGYGLCTGAFQTTSNSTQYRIAIICINAPGGNIEMFFDDFFIGPQTAPVGPVVTDWVQYTPTFSAGFGTCTSVSVYSRRVGDSLECYGRFTAGTVAASVATISLGYNGVSGNVSIDTTKSPSATIVGEASQSSGASTTFFHIAVLTDTTAPTVIKFGAQTSTTSELQAYANASVIVPSNQSLGFYFIVPISGWSSNVQMSSDTDTRVIAANMSGTPTGTISASDSVAKFPTVNKDTVSGYSTSSGLYTVAVTGWYQVFCIIEASFVASAANQLLRVGIRVNSSVVAYGSINSWAASTVNASPSVSVTTYCNAGDTISAVMFMNGTSATYTTSATGSYLSISRVSGPSVIAATESVNCYYSTAAGQSIPNSTNTTIVYGTKGYDSHSAMNSSTGVYTVPVSGKYTVSASWYSVGTAATSADNQTNIKVNNTIVLGTNNPKSGTGTVPCTGFISGDVNCNAGDTIQIQVLQATGGSLSLLANATYNWVTIKRVGN